MVKETPYLKNKKPPHLKQAMAKGRKAFNKMYPHYPLISTQLNI